MSSKLQGYIGASRMGGIGRSWRIAALIAFLGAAGLIAGWGTSVRAQGLSNTPNQSAWVTDGTVRAIATNGTTTYIGGYFTHVGPWIGSGVPIDESSGYPLAVFPKVNGQIFAVAPDGFGGWYIGGSFTRVGNASRNNIAHIDADGAVDAFWHPNADGDVNAWVGTLAVSGKTLYVGGTFSRIGGQNRNNLAALDASTGKATSWNPNAAGGQYATGVYALAVGGSTVYAGGAFTAIGGQNRNNIAALDASTGKATSWNPGANDYVDALVVSSSTIYAGGIFNSIGGQNRNCIAALDPSTGNATSWNPNPIAAGASVNALAVSGGTVYAGGFFGSIGGQNRNCIAALDASTGNATSWNPNANGRVFTIAVSGGTVYAGGFFTSIGGQNRNNLAALSASTGEATAWNPNAFGRVNALAVSGGTVYAGGRVGGIGGVARNNAAALDSSTGKATLWNPNANGYVCALAVSSSTVYVGGDFSSIGGQYRNYIAALDASTGKATSWNPDAGPSGAYVFSFAVSGSTVYAGGHFNSVGGQNRNGIAALDASTGKATSWNPSPSTNGGVFTLAVSGGTVYAGGIFSSIGGQYRNGIAALDASTGKATPWNPNPFLAASVNALAVSGGTVYVGGDFRSIGGQYRNCIAALDASTGKATSWNPDATGGRPYYPATMVNALAVRGSTVYAGGIFSSIGGQNRNYIAALDASTGKATPWNPDASDPVFALAARGGKVYVGGDFTEIGAESRSYFAEFR
ncbi:MAG TPA: hypothetical protein VEF34_09000 [Syntrophobacteraceae bacterium]|nr:hypothetical protein [Syntrophobacteraceae bacterium]